MALEAIFNAEIPVGVGVQADECIWTCRIDQLGGHLCQLQSHLAGQFIKEGVKIEDRGEFLKMK